MKTQTLVLVLPVSSCDTTEQKLWQQAKEILQPHKGTRFDTFEPAVIAWDRLVPGNFGIVLGAKHPLEFACFFDKAKKKQEKIMDRHMDAIADTLIPVGKETTNDGKQECYVFQVKDPDHHSGHLFWHLAMIAGELLPDAGFYFVKEQHAYAEEDMMKEVLSHMAQYALCVVTLGHKGDKT